MNWIKLVLGMGAAAAAGAALLAKKRKTEQTNKELDAYLVPEETEEDRIVLDDEQLPVQITFAAASREGVKNLQDFLAGRGFSSSADMEVCQVAVLYTGDQSVDVLVDASRLPEVTYTGYELME